MKINSLIHLLALCFAFCRTFSVDAQNPIIPDQYTADPSARVFNGKLYLFPSHDIPPHTNKNKENWFSMEDYHVFSSDDLTNWTDHGMIVTQTKVPWVKPDSFSMWAPDCIERNGKYYFYFPSTPKDTAIAKGFTIGVAIADKPEGPYNVLPDPIKNVKGIDPNVFIDKDGQAYLYWSQGHIYGAKLKDNMVELASDPIILQNLPEKGLKEGPYLFDRNGMYYLTYPHVENKIERLEYAIGNNPLGPFTVRGVIMDESPVNCWTNHQSIIEYKKQWYLFYHSNDLSPEFDKNRSARIDSLTFNSDGTIKKVIPTFRGVGLTPAKSKIQVDRYSALSKDGVTVDFLDVSDKFRGWKTVLSFSKAFVRYDGVDFGTKKMKKVLVRAKASSGASVEIRTDKIDGPLLAKVKVAPGVNWDIATAPLLIATSGIHSIYVISSQESPVEVDWLTFE